MLLITVAGLPAHPLLVHVAVVLIPLAALGALAVAVRASWRRPYGPLVALGAVAASLAVTGAKLAGDQLYTTLTAAGAVGPGIDEHDQWGQYTMFASWPFAVLAVIAAVLARRRRPPAHAAGGTAVATGIGVVTLTWVAALAGIATTALVVLAGDTGSRAVWGFVTGG